MSPRPRGVEVPEISRFLGIVVRMYYREHAPPHFHAAYGEFEVDADPDLADELWGEVFQPLRDPAYFGRFAVDHTLVWPNGADFAPEFLHERVSAACRRNPEG